jgi:hypothetical protein
MSVGHPAAHAHGQACTGTIATRPDASIRQREDVRLVRQTVIPRRQYASMSIDTFVQWIKSSTSAFIAETRRQRRRFVSHHHSCKHPARVGLTTDAAKRGAAT